MSYTHGEKIHEGVVVVVRKRNLFKDMVERARKERIKRTAPPAPRIKHVCPRCGGPLTFMCEEVREYSVSPRTGRVWKGRTTDTPRSDYVCVPCDSVVCRTPIGYVMARDDLPPLEVPHASR